MSARGSTPKLVMCRLGLGLEAQNLHFRENMKAISTSRHPQFISILDGDDVVPHGAL